jgi:hypothetical protein
MARELAKFGSACFDGANEQKIAQCHQIIVAVFV